MNKLFNVIINRSEFSVGLSKKELPSFGSNVTASFMLSADLTAPISVNDIITCSLW